MKNSLLPALCLVLTSSTSCNSMHTFFAEATIGKIIRITGDIEVGKNNDQSIYVHGTRRKKLRVVNQSGYTKEHVSYGSSTGEGGDDSKWDSPYAEGNSSWTHKHQFCYVKWVDKAAKSRKIKKGRKFKVFDEPSEAFATGAFTRESLHLSPDIDPYYWTRVFIEHEIIDGEAVESPIDSITCQERTTYNGRNDNNAAMVIELTDKDLVPVGCVRFKQTIHEDSTIYQECQGGVTVFNMNFHMARFIDFYY